MTPTLRSTLALATLLILAQGCGLVAIRLPEEFKNKKLVQDSVPYAGAEPSPWADPAPEEAKP